MPAAVRPTQPAPTSIDYGSELTFVVMDVAGIKMQKAQDQDICVCPVAVVWCGVGQQVTMTSGLCQAV